MESNISDKYIFFWDHKEKEGEVTKKCLSQWYDCQFESEGRKYTTSEQYSFGKFFHYLLVNL